MCDDNGSSIRGSHTDNNAGCSLCAAPPGTCGHWVDDRAACGELLQEAPTLPAWDEAWGMWREYPTWSNQVGGHQGGMWTFWIGEQGTSAERRPAQERVHANLFT